MTITSQNLSQPTGDQLPTSSIHIDSARFPSNLESVARPFNNQLGGALTPEDYQALQERWIDRQTADDAGIKRVDQLEGKDVVGRRDSKDYSGLLIPFCAPGSGDPRGYRIRRDNPEVEHKSDSDDHGTPVNKYMQPPSSRNLLYFPPCLSQVILKGVNCPLIITEGEFKTLALWRLANFEAGEPRFLPIGVNGVWNWRGTVGKNTGPKGERRSVRGVIPDFDLIEFKGRIVYVAFDSDLSTKELVQKARSALTRELQRRGAQVYYLEWDPSKGKGVDDHLALVGPEATLAEINAAQPAESWESQLLTTPNGGVKKLLANAVTAFRSAPEWTGSLRFDEFRQVVSTCKAPPWSKAPISKWTDQESRLAAEWLQHERIEVGDDVAGKAAVTVAMENRFHPLRDWLSGLAWDRAPRIDEWLTTYLGVAPSDYTRMIGPKFLIMMVARGMKPGCKADYMLVLEGHQGVGKSSALKKLVPDEGWFTDQLPEIGTKDAGIQIQGVWLVEAAELDALGRAETSRIKAFLSSANDRYRPPYGRVAEDFPRHSVMAGTTNKESYLRDDTGNRRFWPVRVGAVALEKLDADREQLFAEAVARFQSGEGWWPKGIEQNDLAAKEQEQRFEQDVWTSVSLDWCDCPEAGERFDNNGEKLIPLIKSTAERVQISEILEHAIKKPVPQCNRADEMRVTGILKNAGWTRKLLSVGGKREWFYVRPAWSAPQPRSKPKPPQQEMPF